ncbi:MAG: NAD(P)-dependent oxidoreductase [Candidatus Cohnella colombiensis]|uniref:precorrin-2 dehydrogenase n=1 Tax=Candidatus Cohnella colombiensis TaxID=3121368 RepID=A0AA95JDU2_9BACL|nr:MAG: NAD(P)-dependent oxidoreductase [Cohnella sp.]
MSQWYPVLLNMSSHRCVVMGGGPVAERKVRGLLEAGAQIRLISPTITSQLQQMVKDGDIEYCAREAVDTDLDDATLVFIATNQSTVNQDMAVKARSRGVLVNVAEESTSGDFIVPATLRRGNLVMAVSASGEGPALASRIIGELAEQYGPEYEHLIDILGEIRTIVKREVSDANERHNLLRAAVTEDALREWSEAAHLDDTEQLLARLRQRAYEEKG